MKKLLVTKPKDVLIAAIASFYFMNAGIALAATDDFPGTYSNPDSHTRDIDYIVISKSGDDIFIHVYGKCHPSACDWGAVKAHIYTANVSQSPAVDALVITGNYDQRFSHSEIVLRRLKSGSIVYQKFTHFDDNSRRSDYVTMGELKGN